MAPTIHCTTDHLPITHTDLPDLPGLTISSLYDVLHYTNHICFENSQCPLTTDQMTTHLLLRYWLYEPSLHGITWLSESRTIVQRLVQHYLRCVSLINHGLQSSYTCGTNKICISDDEMMMIIWWWYHLKDDDLMIMMMLIQWYNDDIDRQEWFAK